MARLDDELHRLRDLVDAGALADGCGLVGAEVEFHLIDAQGRPSPCNATVLREVDGGPHAVQSEIARFNVELNLPPTALDGTPLTDIRRGIAAAQEALCDAVPDTSGITIGTLPTLTLDDIARATLSDTDRYHELEASILKARSGTIDVDIDGTDAGGERLSAALHSVLLEGAATSLQIHLDLPADGLVAAWNTAQAVAALQIATAANAPTLLGLRLWHETRIPLFEQLIDERTPAERRGADLPARPPRVWFGRRWIDHPADLFAENVALFPRPLVGRDIIEAPGQGPHPGECEDVGDDASDAALALDALVIHNTTVWRWNRPVYAVRAGRPTLRIENRVLSAPPTATDGSADIALFLGLVAGLRDDIEALTSALPFADAARNFRAAARYGLTADLRWPGRSGATTTAELLTTGLLDVAAAGLDALGVPTSESGPALDVIAARVTSGRNGAAWQLATLAAEEERHDRPTALRRMLLRYRDLQREGEPVHRWPWPTSHAQDRGQDRPQDRTRTTTA